MLQPLEGVVLRSVDFDLLPAALLAGVLIEVELRWGQGLKEGAHHHLVSTAAAIDQPLEQGRPLARYPFLQ
jgi:hypothetical protein